MELSNSWAPSKATRFTIHSAYVLDLLLNPIMRAEIQLQCPTKQLKKNLEANF